MVLVRIAARSVVCLIIATAALPAMPVSADHGPTLGAGPGVHCNLNYESRTTIASGPDTGYAWVHLLLRVACTYGPVEAVGAPLNLSEIRFRSANGNLAYWAITGRDSYGRKLVEESRGKIKAQIAIGLGAGEPAPPGVDYATFVTGPSGNGSTQTVQASTAIPPYPTAHYDGGSGNVPPPAAPVVACSRRLSATSEMVGYFQSSSPAVGGTTDVATWAFGDTTTATGWKPTKLYGALATMPVGGWTATVTVTRTAGTQSATGTCALRVDFLNPDKSTPTTTGQEPEQSDDDTDCPSGWGFLNPLAFVKILKCLFIPPSSSLAGLSTLWGEIRTALPFSVLVDVAAFIPATLTSIQAGANISSGTDCYAAWGPGTSGVALPGTDGVAGPQTCDATAGWEDSAGLARLVLLGSIYIGAAIGLYKAVTETIGK